ncbi:MAG TPA: heavy metal translocating P-type ATPase [Armatimonadota bacterium]|jgi:Cu+-exporting ATPase
MARRQTRLDISGMHCASCAHNVETSLQRVPNVFAAAVNFAAETASVEFDPEHVSPQDLIQAVHDAGYEARVSGGRQVRLRLSGMHCAGCAAGIEKALRETPGVLSVTVNYAAETAEVEHDPHLVSPAELVKVVESRGYHAELDSESGHEGHSDREMVNRRQVLYQRNMLLLGVGLTVPLMVLSMAGAWPGRDWLLLALATPVQFLVGWQYLRNSAVSLRHGAFNMDVLIALGSLAAYLYSLAIVLTGPAAGHMAAGHALYFETGAMIITLITLGRWLEMRARQAASRALRGLLELAPPQANVLRDGGETTIPAEELQVGDVFLVRPGEKVATDGVVEAGEGAVDESLLTGESVPLYKRAGDAVIGATLNQQGVLTVRATSVGAATVLRQIVELMEQAQGQRPPIQRLADRVAGVFVPAILVLAAAVFVAWLLYDPAHWSSRALLNAVSVLVIACPCALGLATPTAIMVGSGLGSRHGILLREAAALERAGQLTCVVWDKTGTLTAGTPRVTEVAPLAAGLSEEELLRLAGSLEAGSEHPLARAMVAAARERGGELAAVTGFSALVGRGVEGTIAGESYLVGSRGLLAERGLLNAAAEAEIGRLQEAGRTVSGLARGGELLGLVALADEPKASAGEAVQRLAALGLRNVLLTGDNQRTAQALAESLGLTEVHAEVLPGEKVAVIRQLQEQGEVVAMVGDGVNDAPALAQADLGLALGTGADVAREAGQITLVSGDPLGVVRALLLSRATLRHIKQNLFWAFFYNVVALPLAALGLLNPMIAAAAMACSSVTVVGNSLRLNRLRLP